MTTPGSQDQPDRYPACGRAAQLGVVAALAVLAGIVSTLAVAPPPPAEAQPTQSAAAPSGLLAVAGQVSPGTYGLYLVDVQARSVVVYEYVPTKRQLHLRAARSAVYDLQLEQYNTAPKVSEVADMVRQARTLEEIPPGPTNGPNPQE